MQLWVIIPAAGSSRRYHEASFASGVDRSGFSKLDEDLGGRPVLQRAVELFTKHDAVAGVFVAGPHDAEAYEAFRLRHGDKLGMMGVKLCRGGKTHRYETVAAALTLVPKDATHIAVHDAARPCTPVEMIDRVFEAAAKHAAVIPALDVGDTLKRVRTDDEAADEEADPLAGILGGGGGGANTRSRRVVEQTVPRQGLVGVQTPQVFEAGLFRRAYAQPELTSTDDAQLVERLGSRGGRIVVIEGDPRNLKITRPVDLELARSILGVKGQGEKAAHLRF
jgi:2-C-methyl-D-erythritol 4-phosphate cytidylyltransferase